MSHMEIRSCSLTGYNRDLMISAISTLKQQLGGDGLLEAKKVRGYGMTTETVDLSFKFQGMYYPMGIRIRNGQVEFIGDPWQSSNWTSVQKKLVEEYKALAIQAALKKQGFRTRVTADNVRGILLEGYQ